MHKLKFEIFPYLSFVHFITFLFYFATLRQGLTFFGVTTWGLRLDALSDIM